jgi:hypothetical protein
MNETLEDKFPCAGKPITHRFLKLDPQNEDLRAKKRICVFPDGPRALVRRTKNGKETKKTVSRIVMERAGKQCPPGMVCDHINGDTLDDRLSNLRFVSRAVNDFNCDSGARSKAGQPRGVYLRREGYRNPYRAQIQIAKRIVCIGHFSTAEAAHEAWKKKALELYGFLPYSVT